MPAPGVELSIVLLCLNEVETLEACLRKAQPPRRWLAAAGNGPADGSQDIARARLSPTRIGEG
ncbi:MAG: hypothetical protein ACRDTH_05990 [Pseudonocardiaceae bacterium]